VTFAATAVRENNNGDIDLNNNIIDQKKTKRRGEESVKRASRGSFDIVLED
jgi:hypothetical protein